MWSRIDRWEAGNTSLRSVSDECGIDSDIGSSEFKRRLYERLSVYTDWVLEIYNPCEIVSSKCKRGYFCCTGCRFLVDNKCSINSLACKIWLCSDVKHDEACVNALRGIYKIAQWWDLLICRGDWESKPGHNVALTMPWGQRVMMPLNERSRYGCKEKVTG